jgi:ribosomal protein L34E
MSIRNVKSVHESLHPIPCKHPAHRVEIHMNRKGRKFRECNKCEAFIGWYSGKRKAKEET